MEMPRTQWIKSIIFSKARFILSLCILLFTATQAFSQEALPVAYKGMVLPVDLSGLTTQNCSAIHYSPIDNVEKIRHEYCAFNLVFDRLGEMQFQFTTDSSSLVSYRFNVKSMPAISVGYSGAARGYIELSAFLAQKELGLDYDPEQWELPVRIETFKIEHYRNNERLFRKLNLHAKYSTEIQNLIKRVEIGDIIRVTEVFIEVADFKPYSIEGFEIRITD